MPWACRVAWGVGGGWSALLGLEAEARRRWGMGVNSNLLVDVSLVEAQRLVEFFLGVGWLQVDFWLRRSYRRISR